MIEIIKNTGESEKQPRWSPLALGFRPFFFAAGWIAVLLMLVFVGVYSTQDMHGNYFEFQFWHAHEMLFGFSVAVIAGFLLTAARNWTGLPTPSGKTLGFLVGLWLAPRLLSAVPLIPAPLFAAIDLLFLPAVAFALIKVLHEADQSKNFIMPAILLMMTMINLAVHLEILGIVEDIARPAMQFMLNLVVVLIVLMAGRVVPFFIGSAVGSRPETFPVVERFALASAFLFAATELIVPDTWLSAAVALAVAILHSLRLKSWYQPGLWQQPMLWVLYLAYGWLVIGFFLHALADMMLIERVQAMHAFTIGAISTIAMGMMARVSLGHSGRRVQALPWMPAAFILLMLASFIRVVLPLLWPDNMEIFIHAAGCCWVVAFIIFGIRYSAILMRPRSDGQPG
jgi:uncharacterized protein involved in response to NO